MQRRVLWQHGGSDTRSAATRKASQNETYESILAKYSSRPPPVPLGSLLADAVAIGQEFILACLLLARHRAALILDGGGDESKPNVLQMFSISGICIVGAMLIVIGCNNRNNDGNIAASDPRRRSLYRRVCDAIIIAVLLRFSSAVLKTLTASYSSDTVHALSLAGLTLHFLTCNYAYSNGVVADGSVVSLSATFFSTILLASRLDDNVSAFVFVSTSIILFGLYPDARHRMAATAQKRGIWVPLSLLLTTLFGVATSMLLSLWEFALMSSILFAIIFVSPLYKHYLLRHQVCLNGPWDIAQVTKPKS